MSLRNALCMGGLAVTSLAWSVSGCGGEDTSGAVADGPLEVASGDLVSVTPSVELIGLGEDGELGTVYVDDLLLNVEEIRLRPADAAQGEPVREYVADPIWIQFHHETGAVVRGRKPMQVPEGRYHVSLTLAPSRFQKRTAGELNEASVVVRGACIVVEQVEDEETAQGPRFPGGRNPGFQSNNPVPMPARPDEGEGRGGSHADMRTRLIQVPFSVKTGASITVDVAEPLDLRGVNAGDLHVRMDVPAWVEQAIQPMVSEAVRAHDASPERVVELDFAGDAEEDPMADIIAEILGKSMEGALSAHALP